MNGEVDIAVNHDHPGNMAEHLRAAQREPLGVYSDGAAGSAPNVAAGGGHFSSESQDFRYHSIETLF